jgi:hypothetical protein
MEAMDIVMANSAAISYFHTGDPVGLTRSRLYTWKPVPVAPPPIKHSISFERSQKEQNNMMKTRFATHPYITGQALELIKK